MKESASSFAGLRRGGIITLITVLLVPLLFSALILTSSWSPYDNLSNLPVAVVNNDKGGISGDKPINVGEDLVANLKESNTLGWNFVSQEEADRGLKNLEYYMVVEIPENFSENITTVLDDTPQVPELKYTKNEGLHYMASQVTNTAIERIREQLGDTVTKTYITTLFNQLDDVVTGFEDGAAGSQQLNEGASKLKEGTGTILESLQEKSPDITKLADGSQQLKSGTSTLLQKVQGGTGSINQLANGSGQLKNGTSQILGALKGGTSDVNRLADGAKQVDDGAKRLDAGTKDVVSGVEQIQGGSNRILNGLNEAKAGSEELNIGLQQLAPGSQQLLKGINDATGGISDLNNGAKDVADGVQKLVDKIMPLIPLLPPGTITPETSKDIADLLDGSRKVSNGLAYLNSKTTELKTGAEKIAGGLANAAPGAKSLNDGLSELVAGQTELVKGSSNLLTGAKTLSAGATELTNGTSQVANGNASLNHSWGTLTGSVAQVDTGLAQIAGGTQTLKGSWSELSSGARQIDTGMTQVKDGTQTVKTGWATLTDGVEQVDDGIAQLEDGSDELASGLQGGAETVSDSLTVTEANIAQFASPITLAGTTINEFPKYSYANAPYILSLGLFIGVLVLALFFDIRKPEDVDVSNVTWFGSLFAKMSGFAAIQAVIMTGLALFFVKLSVTNAFLLLLFAIIASITFLAIVFFLVALAGNVGRFIAVAFVVLQLSTTGSSLPVEMLPEGLRSLSNFLPMRYSIDSFRALISLDNMSSAWSNIAILLIFFGIAVLLTAIVALFLSSKKASSKTTFEA